MFCCSFFYICILFTSECHYNYYSVIHASESLMKKLNLDLETISFGAHR
jgi:putative lipase involved disintegration of autophagic bodies